MQQLNRYRDQRSDVLGTENCAKPSTTQHRLQAIFAVNDRAKQRVTRIQLATPRGVMHLIGRHKRHVTVPTTVGLCIGHSLT